MEKWIQLWMADPHRGRAIDGVGGPCAPKPGQVAQLVRSLRMLLFPGYCGRPSLCAGEQTYLAALLARVHYQLETLVQPLCRADCREFMEALLPLREILEQDLQAFLAGDPAAAGAEEVLICYPGFYAITVQRLAHLLHSMGVPLLPRMMTELAHSKTGIDIHPGAVLGPSFFIDHGTGVVIGETTVIGAGVKLYQGVTLGALSTKDAPTLRGVKRHPTLEDGVTVYAGASILGGNTVIGAGAVIGANAFVTGSVEPGATVIGHRPGP